MSEPIKVKGPLDHIKNWVTTLHFACLGATPFLFYMNAVWGNKMLTVDLVTFVLALLFPPFGLVKPEEHFSSKNCPPPMMTKRADSKTTEEKKTS
mmetsp:Transcript_18139/g.25820  ORF Transcript_18139/g.25820 Transcript_18139/m.25820 type:complete len:95 (-) Transcript_18139:1313-1597(-)